MRDKMEKLFSKFMCKLGFHKWEYGDGFFLAFYGGKYHKEMEYKLQRRCKYCGQVQRRLGNWTNIKDGE